MNKPVLPSDFGIVYLSAGTGCMARLLVSIRTLKRNYSGNVAIYSIGGESHELCRPIAQKYGAKLIEREYVVPEGHNRVLLEKIKLLEASPFAQTLYVDSDTMVMKPLEPEIASILPLCGDFAVTQFTTWKVSQGIIQRRLRAWPCKEDQPMIDGMSQNAPAINTGVYFFRRGLYWARQWYELALRGREKFISDEVGLQILLPHVPHFIMPAHWNHSCRYGFAPERAVIWHFHGRKHCRPGLEWGADKWMAELMQAVNENDCGVLGWLPGQDRPLRRWFKKNPLSEELKAKARSAAKVEAHTVAIQSKAIFNPVMQPQTQPVQPVQTQTPPVPPELPPVKSQAITEVPTQAVMAAAPPPGHIQMHTGDHRILRHGRDRYKGYRIGIDVQTPPLLFTKDGHNVWLGDIYRGRSAFLVCGGPSLKQIDLSLLNQRGILTYTLNNAVSVVRSQLWSCVDDPGHFVDVMWRDPAIMKLIPLDHMDKRFNVRDERGTLVPSKETVGEMPNVLGFRRNENFVAEQYLWESTVNWGNHSEWKDADGFTGARSIMLAAVRILYYLGVRTVYLLGCDFKMEVGQQNYAFDQDRSPGSVRGNNYTYMVLNKRFDRLKPIFDEEGYQVFNCTPNSGLKAFPYKDYQAAVAEATASMPKQIVTAGMYDASANRKKQQKMDVERQ